MNVPAACSLAAVLSFFTSDKTLREVIQVMPPPLQDYVVDILVFLLRWHMLVRVDSFIVDTQYIYYFHQQQNELQLQLHGRGESDDLSKQQQSSNDDNIALKEREHEDEREQQQKRTKQKQPLSTGRTKTQQLRREEEIIYNKLAPFLPTPPIPQPWQQQQQQQQQPGLGGHPAGMHGGLGGSLLTHHFDGVGHINSNNSINNNNFYNSGVSSNIEHTSMPAGANMKAFDYYAGDFHRDSPVTATTATGEGGGVATFTAAGAITQRSTAEIAWLAGIAEDDLLKVVAKVPHLQIVKKPVTH